MRDTSLPPFAGWVGVLRVGGLDPLGGVGARPEAHDPTSGYGGGLPICAAAPFTNCLRANCLALTVL